MLTGTLPAVDDLVALRLRAARLFAALLWLHVPVVIAIAQSNHLPTLRVGAIMAVAAALGTLALRFWGADAKARCTLAAGITFAPILMVYAASGPWQIDYHMYFFVVYGALVAFVDWRPILVSAGLTAVHHLILNALFPRAIFPEADFDRVLLHVVIVAVDAGVLFWIIHLIGQSYKASSASLGVARRALESAQLFKSVVLNVNDAVIIGDVAFSSDGRLDSASRKVIYVNEAFTRMSGYASNDIVGKTLDPLHGAKSNVGAMATCVQAVAETGAGNYTDVWYARDGRELDVEGSMVAVEGSPGKFARMVSIVRDVTQSREASQAMLRAQIAEETNAVLKVEIGERQRAERRLAFAAYHDELTGLGNRAYFRERLSGALAASGDGVPEPAVLLIDLDRFKLVNDGLGHMVGDLLLVAVADRLTRCLRDEDVLSRIGGDEFTLLVVRAHDIDELSAIADRVLESFAAPFEITGLEMYAAASIGIASGRHTSSDEADDMLRNADLAMYKAKSLGRGRYELFTPELLANSERLLKLDTQLRRAMERLEMTAYYQPVVRLSNRRLCGFEALVRWRHPVVGVIQPDEFIKTAEETGIIVELGQFMLDTACAQLRIWLDRFPDYPELWVSVNVAVQQLHQAGYASGVADTLRRHSVPARLLHLEITESTIVSDFAAIGPLLLKLREIGVHISIDDFGTGFSSLQYLDKLTIDTLKIDRSFVSGRGEGVANLKIVRTIVNLANDLGLAVISEGIETASQAEVLRALTRGYGQGYLFGRPLAADAASDFLTRPTQIAANTLSTEPACG